MKRNIYPGRPYKQNDLFTGGEDISLNACVGKNGGPYNLDAYARGYFKGAICIVDSIIKDSSYVDLLIYPVVFNYRHGVELYLKHLSEVLPKFLNEKSIVRPTHILIDNWDIVRNLLKKIPVFDPDKSLISVVDKILKDLIDIDPNGEAFRFPHARSGNKFLQNTSLINVMVLANTMNTVFDAFSHWDYVAQELMDNK
ncbi:MAG: hypothetical protein HY919_03765 [Elusimicrobia bacterium]|nr:hypothetical protein [Elusimicrobiota bacterium]